MKKDPNFLKCLNSLGVSKQLTRKSLTKYFVQSRLFKVNPEEMQGIRGDRKVWRLQRLQSSWDSQSRWITTITWTVMKQPTATNCGLYSEEQQGKYTSSMCYVYHVLAFLTGGSHLSAYLLAHVFNILNLVILHIFLLANKRNRHESKMILLPPTSACIQSLIYLIPLCMAVQ